MSSSQQSAAPMKGRPRFKRVDKIERQLARKAELRAATLAYKRARRDKGVTV